MIFDALKIFLRGGISHNPSGLLGQVQLNRETGKGVYHDWFFTKEGGQVLRRL